MPNPNRGAGRPRALAVLLVGFALAASCAPQTAPPAAKSEQSGSSTPAAGPPRVLRVPADHPSIQAAVKSARRGDMVLVGAGEYHESVQVDVAGIVIRGMDRNAVVVDGDFKRENGFFVGADEVAIENLTVRNFNANGIFFTGSSVASTGSSYGTPSHTETPGTILRGWRASYITAYNNGLYGLYAFSAQGGRFDNSYASGHPDSGFYVGQCNPCDSLITDVIAENNAVGFEGTNASNGVYVVNSIWRQNRVGITFNSQKAERLSPQSKAVVGGNLVVNNNSAASPAQARGGFGLGIAIGGSRSDLVVRNRISGNASAGVYLTSLEAFMPEDNRIEANVLDANGVDLAYALAAGQTGAKRNCFTANTFKSSSPLDIEKVLPCVSDAPGGPAPFSQKDAPPGFDFRKMPAPPAQPTMPNADTAPAQLATTAAPNVDLASLTVPALAP